MRVVRWGDRTYLIEEGEFADFCNDVNAGSEPREDSHGGVYERKGDESKQVTGLPEVPEAWRAWLFESPRKGHVVRAEGDSTWVIDLGAADGLRPGMQLFGGRSEEFLNFYLEVTSVAEHETKVRLWLEPLRERLAVGDAVCTRLVSWKPR